MYKKTLRYLRDQLYPAHLITIFVADEEQAEAYRRATPELLYGQIVVGVKGLAEQRKFISDYYPEGELIVQMDDDISGLVGDKSLQEIVEMAERLLREHKAALFSVMPNSDTRRLKSDYTLHLTHAIGSFFVVKNDKRLLPTGTEMEDYERSILAFKHYGKVIRFRGAGVKTNYGKTSGGLQEEGRFTRIRQGVERVGYAYPQYCAAIVKNGRPDLRLNWRASVKEDADTPHPQYPGRIVPQDN